MSISEEKIIEVDIIKVKPNPDQPRGAIPEGALDELTESIKEYGVLGPIRVFEKDGNYIIVTGYRRWIAAKEAGLKTVPVVITE